MIDTNNVKNCIISINSKLDTIALTKEEREGIKKLLLQLNDVSIDNIWVEIDSSLNETLQTIKSLNIKMLNEINDKYETISNEILQAFQDAISCLNASIDTL